MTAWKRTKDYDECINKEKIKYVVTYLESKGTLNISYGVLEDIFMKWLYETFDNNMSENYTLNCKDFVLNNELIEMFATYLESLEL